MGARTYPFAFPPIAMRREVAAAYVGIGTTKFGELVESGDLPGPITFGGCVLWDRVKLEAAWANYQDRQVEPDDPWKELRRARARA